MNNHIHQLIILNNNIIKSINIIHRVIKIQEEEIEWYINSLVPNSSAGIKKYIKKGNIKDKEEINSNNKKNLQ